MAGSRRPSPIGNAAATCWRRAHRRRARRTNLYDVDGPGRLRRRSTADRRYDWRVVEALVHARPGTFSQARRLHWRTTRSASEAYNQHSTPTRRRRRASGPTSAPAPGTRSFAPWSTWPLQAEASSTTPAVRHSQHGGHRRLRCRVRRQCAYNWRPLGDPQRRERRQRRHGARPGWLPLLDTLHTRVPLRPTASPRARCCSRAGSGVRQRPCQLDCDDEPGRPWGHAPLGAHRRLHPTRSRKPGSGAVCTTAPRPWSALTWARPSGGWLSSMDRRWCCGRERVEMSFRYPVAGAINQPFVADRSWPIGTP